MAERVTPPEAAADPPAGGLAGGTATFVQGGRSRPAAGPQAWAVVLTLAGGYYVWTRVLGKSLPGFLRGGGHRVGSHKGRGGGGGVDRQADVRAARERRLLQQAAQAQGTAAAAA